LVAAPIKSNPRTNRLELTSPPHQHITLNHNGIMMKTTLLCSLISILFIASYAFVVEHNALQHRGNKMRLNLKQTVSNQVSFSKKAATPKHDPTPNEDTYDDNAFHRRIVHFEHHRKDEDENDGKKHSKKAYGGWNHRQFAKSIDP